VSFGAAAGADLGFGGVAYPPSALSARWTGYYTASSAGDYDFFVQSTGEAGGYYRLYVDGKLDLDDWSIARALVDYSTLALTQGPHKIVLERHGRFGFLGSRLRFGIVHRGSYVDPAAEKIAASADAVVVAAGFDPETESEGADRTFRLPPGQDELIEKMSVANKRVIVVITSGGAVDMNAWIDRIPALLEAWYPGQEGGTALAQIIFGDVNPSGRLPVSFERRWEDNPVHDSYYPEPGSTRVVYKEGMFVGYRGYEYKNVKTRFEFGSGLSYSTFQYRSLNVRPISGIPGPTNRNLPRASAPLYEASFDVTNTGGRAGATVAEVYAGESHPRIPRPLKELKGFARVNLRPGETRHVTIPLNGRAFSFYDVSARGWRVNPGEFTVYVGQSVDQLELKKALIVSPSTAESAASPP
jgi:beta-glucosidase